MVYSLQQYYSGHCSLSKEYLIHNISQALQMTRHCTGRFLITFGTKPLTDHMDCYF